MNMKKRIVSGNGPVLITSPSYQEKEVVLWVRDNVINACPYTGPESGEREFRAQLNLFFWHILQCSLYPARKHKKKKFGRVWVPFPRSLGQEKLPMVFGHRRGGDNIAVGKYAKSKKGTFDRSLDWLRANIFETKNYNKAKGLCREFRMRPEVLDGMYGHFKPQSHYDILHRIRFYSPLKILREDYGVTVWSQIQKNSKLPFKRPVHDLSSLDRNRDRGNGKELKGRALYRAVLDKLLPNEVNLDPILAYLEDRSLIANHKARKQYLQVKTLLDTIVSGPVQIVSESPLVVRYWPKYKLSQIGGRLFEVGGGFQNLPSSLKEDCYTIGTNWDMKSSQFNVLRKEFEANGIECAMFDTVSSVEDIARILGLDKRAAKVCLYATIFSAGQLEVTSYSNVFKELTRFMPKYKVKDELIDWNTRVTPLWLAITDLLAVYRAKFRKNKNAHRPEYGVLQCATGSVYDPDPDETDKKIKKRVLNHMLSGWESMFLFDAILNCPNVKGVYSLEHDGALLCMEGESISSPNAEFVCKKFYDKKIFSE
ncbi:hypothetical protein MPK66_gp220 [Erwinia phage pEa_SNUABM_2]|uniref:Uncharacterized protein n=1 Tax=Erwinia phage pEa_SNUABM_2 TaxID=2869547 RepID=A0AAE7XQR0_9CAUD|nr:hypothetical protein MPK66_gp220 [Erwinia phage pEa_SNUABM_2]QZE59464.1 hypothetical protein pEaSNUABM2_00220 [Erwinia phage pEa_SNUABM_2]QZE59800.1 hypothetical protein pEaSNUABM39_00220 [Erwinia phage pEa_SNUABM_39]